MAKGTQLLRFTPDELAEFKSTNLWLLDSVKVDSMYNYWDAYVQAHPKEELAWRKLFEVCSNQEYRLRIKNWEEGIALHGKRVLPLLERMKAAIPGTYQYYYCAHEGGYPMPLETQHALADSAIALLSEKTIASDYELWVQGLIVRRDTLKLTQVLTRYYESGQYPEEALQYHFNELQGMDEGGLYIGAHEGDIIGKLILQLVLGVHRDKILYDENAAMNPDYLKSVFRNIGKSFYDNFSAFEAGLDISLDMPVFLLPFTRNIVFQRIKPHTLFSAGGSYQYRYYFERILANTSFGYTWSHSRRVSNQLLPIEMTFVRMLSLDDGFATRLSQINDLRLKYQYSSHFILDARYDYTFSNQQYGTRNDFTAFHFSIETAGNLLAAVATLSHAETDENNVRQILGVPYSQYIRAGMEATHYHYFGNKSSFVARFIIGTGIPYGNSVSMPYEKSFFGGGPTTMRAWQLRRLGPGSYHPGSGDQVADVERVGDLQLVMNLEGRFPIAGIFEGAVFADMGNVWLFRPSDQYPNGHIKLNSLPKEVAVGAGLGLRVTIAIATLRIDFGIPFYDPGYDEGQRWRPPHWRFNQIVTNFGINYPF